MFVDCLCTVLACLRGRLKLTKDNQAHYKPIFIDGVRISSDKASNLPKRSVEITTGETRHIQQIYIESRRCTIAPEFVFLKRGFLYACNNSTS